MKRLIQRLASRTVANDTVWRVLDTAFLRLPRYLDVQRAGIVAERRRSTRDDLIEAAIQNRFPDLVVKHGPFAGMRYPAAEAVYSAMFPKLLGSYERELAPVVEAICGRDYSDVVDVGCAEGYYAVGLARRLTNARIHAFDTDTRATSLCSAMAALNHVQDRVSVGSFCSPETIRALASRRKVLILADCEGYEKKLFTSDTIQALRSHDVLVEAHDFIDISISDYLRTLFASTHHIDVIESLDDIAKARRYVYPELEGFNLADRRALLAEHRPTIMEWMFMTSREHGDAEAGRPAEGSLHR